MVAEVTRTFTSSPAVRQATPLLFGIYGPSGSGKTYSALRLATGMQRVCGGEIFYIDSEANRALAYADKFKFTHVPFGAPFSPLDYLAAIEYCVSKGARVIVVDSMSHEHEGPGGVLEEHDAEMVRLAQQWRTSESKTTIAAWSAPKAKRRRLINTILQLNVNIIFCFRAKEKLKIVSGKDPQQLGFMPIGSEELVYELMAAALLMPNAKGIPTWNPIEIGEKVMVKLPEQFVQLFAGDPRPLDEKTGETLAQWAAGVPPVSDTDVEALIKSYADATKDTLKALESKRQQYWSQISADWKSSLKAAADAAKTRLA